MAKKPPALFEKFIYILIAVNVIAMILESHESVHLQYYVVFQIFETISIIIFSGEYFYRIYLGYKNRGLRGVSKYIFSTFGLIDLISILPFYLNRFISIDGRFLRILRLFRLTRIF